jgi:CheY-like chemotaxis protein
VTSQAPSPSCVVIVEDDLDVRETLVEVLTEEGYPTTAFAGGHAALRYLQSGEQLPELILLDLMMPVMDGWQFRREQKRLEHLSAVPTVILSADGNIDRNMATLEASGYLRKPIHIKALLQLVGDFCGPPRAPS